MIEKLCTVAQTFQMDYLTSFCDNIKEGQEELNPSISTFLMEQLALTMHERFFDNSLLSDFKFEVEGKTILAHKALVTSRSNVLHTLLCGDFAEASQEVVKILPLSEEEDQDQDEDKVDFKTVFKEFVYYLYKVCSCLTSPLIFYLIPTSKKDKSPEFKDAVMLLAVATKYGVPRLVNLCELWISKAIEVSVKDSIEKADIDVIGLFLFSEQHNAKQLSAFCMHFICTNYLAMCKRKEFELLNEDHRKICEEQRWPPVSYLKELEEYEKKMQQKGKGEKCTIF